MRIARTAPEDLLSGRHPRSSGSMVEHSDVLGADSVYVSREGEELLEEIEEERAGRASGRNETTYTDRRVMGSYRPGQT